MKYCTSIVPTRGHLKTEIRKPSLFTVDSSNYESGPEKPMSETTANCNLEQLR